ncbi:MAG: hypothetical protein KBT00_03670 [Bacteroidales bacterium]|nr:hypothetical protein [Candidatus Cacconaster merdequi]
MKKILVFAIAAIISVPSMFAQGPETLLLPGSAASTAIGGISQAVPDHDSTTFGINAGYMMWAPKEMNSTLIGANVWFAASESLEININGGMLSGQPSEISGITGEWSGKSFTPKDIFAKVGALYKLSSGLAFGAKVNFVKSSLAETGLSTFGADVCVQYRKNNIKAEFAACNLASQVALCKADAAYTISGFTASAELDFLFAGGLMAGIGAEYSIADIVSLRAGYHYGEAIPSFLSAGLGFKFAGINLDAAYIIYDTPLAGTISATLGYSF